MLRIHSNSVIKAMNMITKLNTKNYDGDIKYDIRTIVKNSKVINRSEGKSEYVFMSRRSGTELYNLQETFLKGSPQYISAKYHEGGDNLRIFILKVKEVSGEDVLGDLYSIQPKEFFDLLNEYTISQKIEYYDRDIIIEFESGNQGVFSRQNKDKLLHLFYDECGKVIDETTAFEPKEKISLATMLEKLGESDLKLETLIKEINLINQIPMNKPRGVVINHKTSKILLEMSNINVFEDGGRVIQSIGKADKIYYIENKDFQEFTDLIDENLKKILSLVMFELQENSIKV